MHIAEVMHGHYKPSEMARMIVTNARKYGMHVVSIEDSPGARLMQSTIANYALTVGWDVHISWTPFVEDSGGIDQDVRLNRALWQLAEKMAELKGIRAA